MRQVEQENAEVGGVERSESGPVAIEMWPCWPVAENRDHSIHFQVEKIAPDNRLRLTIATVGLDNIRQLDNLTPDTALDWIYRILAPVEISGPQRRVETPNQTTGTETWKTKHLTARASLNSSLYALNQRDERSQILRSISTRQFPQLAEKEVGLKATLPFSVILRLQLSSGLIGPEISTRTFWARIWVTDGLSRNIVCSREVTEDWSFGYEPGELEIGMPGLGPGQFELFARVVLPFAVKSEQQKLPIQVIS